MGEHWKAAVALVLTLSATDLFADEFKLTPSVAVRQEYNSNIFFDSSNEKDDFITRVKPGLELINRTERLDLRLAGFVTPYVYWSNEELNSVDQDYSGRVDFRLTPLLSLGANAAVRVDHQPDRDIYTTGLAYSDNRRLQQNYGGNVGYMFTEKTSGSVTYGYTKEDWRNSSNNSDLENYDSHAVTVGLARELRCQPFGADVVLDTAFTCFLAHAHDRDLRRLQRPQVVHRRCRIDQRGGQHHARVDRAAQTLRARVRSMYDRAAGEIELRDFRRGIAVIKTRHLARAVSYTHLTLPTILLV